MEACSHRHRRRGRPSSRSLVAALAAVAFFSASRATAQDVAPLPSPLPLEWCLERASASNPAIAEQLAASEAATERIRPAGALDDPRFAYDASNVPTGDFDFNSTPLSGHQLGLKQRIPFPGLLRNREQAAEAAAEAAAADLEDRQVHIRAAVEQSWSSLGFAQRALEITDRNLETLRQLTKIAEVKYRVGTGLQQDVLRSQVALTALLQDRLRREAAVESSSAMLGALLDLPPETVYPRTSALADEAPLPELERLFGTLEATSPRLRAASVKIEEAKRQLRATELEGMPDFDVGIGYRVRRRVMGDAVNGDDFLSAGVAIRLPVDRAKWRARIAERRALVRKAEAMQRRVRAGLRGRLRSAYAELVRAHRETELLGSGLVPQSQQSLDSSRSGYQVGRVDFLSLLDSQVRLLEAELRHVRAVADRRSAFASLETTLGEKLR